MSDDPRGPSQDPEPKPDTQSAARGAEAAADAERLLPGEDEVRSTLEDAALWVDVYRELLEFKQKLLADAAAQAALMRHEEARREVEDTDVVVLRAEGRRLARRLAFWQGRLRELSEP
jgi:hypothetical protein